ncbi:MAG: BTAD domain-containing putative transcriptional regulator [Blastocatellia bacterium]
MMPEKENKPFSQLIVPSLQQPTYEEATKTYRYEAVAELLSEVRSSCESEGDDSLICMIDAAYRISKACCCAWDEVEWHKQAYSKAHQRQVQLLRELTSLVEMLSPAGQNKLLPLRNPDGAAASAKYGRLVQCIKDLLETKPVPGVASKTVPLVESRIEQALTQLAEADSATFDALAEETTNGAQTTRPSLAIYFLSPFRVLLDEQPVVGWPNCKGKSIFKYLVTHRQRPIPKEVLMEAFWPEGDPDAARNNLNVAIYGLRKSLNKVNINFSYVLFQDDCYLLNPELDIWVDSETFMAHVRQAKEYESTGDHAAAIHEYRAAEAIYQGEFLVEDRYEEWLVSIRQNFQDTYLAVMNRLSCYYFDQKNYETCVTMCAKALAVDSCNEELHRRLMQCYNLMGYTHLALRQFHICRENLIRDLNIMPSKETMQLFEEIRRRQSA